MIPVGSIWEERVLQRQRDKRFVRALWDAHAPLLRWPLTHPESELISRVARLLFVSREDILGRSKLSHHVEARAVIAVTLCRRGYTTSEAGRVIGGRDHSTVTNLTQKIGIYCKRNPLVAEAVERLER